MHFAILLPLETTGRKDASPFLDASNCLGTSSVFLFEFQARAEWKLLKFLVCLLNLRHTLSLFYGRKLCLVAVPGELTFVLRVRSPEKLRLHREITKSRCDLRRAEA